MNTVKILAYIITIVILIAFGTGLYVNFAMPNVGAAPELIVKKNSAQVERGKYLANHVTVCIDCHSKRDWTSFSGPVIAGTEGGGGEVFDQNAGFPGTIYSTNLTPARLASWTDGEIYRAVTSGVNKEGHALFPLMGYKRFGKMSKGDVESVIAYIRTLRPVENQLPKTQLDFPVSLLNKLSPQTANHQDIPSPSNTIAYGAYLVNAAGCVDCHSQQDKGEIISGTEFAGGMEFKQPAGIIRSPNITKDKTGIGSWTKELFVTKFRAFADKNYTPAKLKPDQLNTPMPWIMYGGMTEEDLGAIYTYLNSLDPIVNKVEVRSPL